MTPPSLIKDLLRWRAARAEAEAPPTLRAARLLALARPWWEEWPARFRAAAERVNTMQAAYGHAMAAPPPGPSGHPAPVVVVREGGDLETFARVLFLSVRDGRLRLRFQLDAGAEDDIAMFEATFLAEGETRVLFDASATRSVEDEYRVDAAIPPALEAEWAPLRVTDHKPFRLILRAAKPRDDRSSD